MNFVNVGYASTNYYVIGDGKNRLLVDVGWPGTLGKLLANLKRMGIALEDIRFVLATHYHPDHAGLIQEVKNKGIRLLLVDGQHAAVPELKQWMKPEMRYLDIDLRDAATVRIDASRAFLATLGIAGEIIATPGHSGDSVTVVLDSGDAFTGDLESESRAQDGMLETVTESWRRIRALGARTAHPGHGPARPLGNHDATHGDRTEP